MALIPEENRIIVTTHDAFAYFAEAYGFESISITGVPSTDADVAAGRIAELITELRELNVPAIFVENITNRALTEQIAREANIVVASELYTDALGQAGTPGETYLGMMRYNVDTIVEALQ